jgi:putative ubiquitin-RnfH superfamily antitoxin RatB of RatAB toxin-antitoxin module
MSNNTATVEATIRESGILARFPEIDLTSASVGIFGKPCAMNQPVRPGDRIEIYRPLIVEPRAARRERVQRR